MITQLSTNFDFWWSVFLSYHISLKKKIRPNLKEQNMSMLPIDRNYSLVEAEVITLDSAMAACHHWIYHSNEVESLSDCESLLGMMDNKKLQKISETAANYDF